tara:strand:+ start:1464 stop:3509 length:2046 start_codon:yes stop_codon:yes gene_type:complete
MENILAINLASSTSPVIQEVRGRDYIEYGTDEWKNLYPQFLIDLYYNSSTHAAIINATSDMIAGTDIIALEDDNLEAYVGLKKFLANANGSESLHEVVKKIAFDFKLQGGYALNIIWSQDRQTISEIYHIPVERVRAGRPNELGKIDTYFVSADWANIRENEPQPVAAFNVNDRSTPSQLLYTGSYSPNMDIYHTPDYNCMNWALVDQRVAEFHLNNIQNGFSGSYFINFANGVPTREERMEIERSIEEKFTGARASGKFVLTFSDSKENTPEITPIAVSNADKQYLALQELLMQNILTGHRCTSPMLVGISSENGFGSNAEELNSAFEIYLNTVIKPFQSNILKTLNKILTVNGINLPLEFVQSKPITTMFTVEDMKMVMTTDEIRKEMGLPELKEEEEQENFSKVGMIDGKPVFSTIEEAEAHAKSIGCSGYHAHEYNGETAYMACKDHSEATDLTKMTELEKFIDECGEDMPEDWELVEEEVVDGEHQDFDFEEVLNEAANEKLELASTGTARPDSKSSQDGVNKSYNDFYKVRYVYTKDNFLSQKGETREFCRIMMASKKIYRKEDIISMGNRVVNAGWGKGGADTYSIWLADQVEGCCNSLKDNKLELYKGGGNCHHFWLRQIYKTSLRGAKGKINSNQLISYTKARSEGFTAEKNDNLVARPPKRMKNNGFIKKR